jgi:hypothetical protein
LTKEAKRKKKLIPKLPIRNESDFLNLFARLTFMAYKHQLEQLKKKQNE